MATITGDQGYWHIDLIVNETKQDIINNTSTVNWELRLRYNHPYGTYTYMWGTPTISVNVSGKNVHWSREYKRYGSESNPTIGPNGILVVSGTVTGIEHNDDGTIKDNTASFSWTGAGFTPNNISAYGSYDAPQIERRSIINATRAYIGEASQLSITRYVEGFTHSIAYSFGTQSGYILPNGTTSTTEYVMDALFISFPIPTAWYDEIPDKPFDNCTLTVTTYNGTLQIGSTYSMDFRVMVDEINNKPQVTTSVVDTNADVVAITGSTSQDPILVTGYSTASVTWSAVPQTGSSIADVYINETEVTQSPHVFPFTTKKIVVAATDSRGLINRVEPEFTLVDYTNPLFAFDGYRVNDTSRYINIKFNGTWFNDNIGMTPNTISRIYWQYIKSSDLTYNQNPTWIMGGVLVENTDYKISGNTFYSGNGSEVSEIQIGGQLEYEYEYVVALVVEDVLHTTITTGALKTITIGQGIPIINWEEDFVNINGDIRQYNVSILDRFSYSTNEIVVGTYDNGIDVVPVYRRMFVGTSTSSDKVLIALSDLDIDLVIDGFGWIKAIYNQWWQINNHYVYENGYDTSTHINTNNELVVNCGAYYSYPEYRIVLTYTKTPQLSA